jgi:hypothetical protein
MLKENKIGIVDLKFMKKKQLHTFLKFQIESWDKIFKVTSNHQI